MKFSLSAVTAVVAALSQTAVALPSGENAGSVLQARGEDWQCNGDWNDGGLKRLSFTFQGYCEDRYGQCFLDRLRARGLTVHNWQCWRRDDGWWQVDFSTTAGLAWQANNAVEDVTHSWRGCWPNK